MDTDSILTIVAMVVLVLLSAYFSATETAFSSLNKTRIKSMSEEGNKRATLVLKLSEKYDRLLSTTLVGNNIVNIALTSIATLFFIGVMKDADLGATVSTIVITVVVLIFGEITPKSMAKEKPEKFAMFSAPILRVLIFILYPINWIFSLWKMLVDKIAGLIKSDKEEEDESKYAHSELLTIVDEVAEEGGIDEEESELLKSAIEFNDLSASDIITPRVDMEGVSRDADKADIARVFNETGYSRLPVYDETIDNIIGVLHLKDFYDGVSVTEKSIEELMSTPVYVTPTMKIDDLLKLLQKEKTHVAIVADEYGGTLGMVTMEDILEELVGEIWDEHDEVIEEFQKIDENKYRILCSADLDAMFELFSITGEAESATVSGWVLEQLGQIPSEGDAFAYDNLDVVVTATDNQRVLEIEVTVNEPESEDGEDGEDK